MLPNRLDFSKPHVLRNEAEYDLAVAEMTELLDRDPPEGTEDYDRLELITVLIAAYDAEHVRFGDEKVSPEEVVDFILAQQGMSRSDLSSLMGGKSRVSEFFSGARPLSMSQLQNLHTHLGIPAELLLPATVEKAEVTQPNSPPNKSSVGVFRSKSSTAGEHRESSSKAYTSKTGGLSKGKNVHTMPNPAGNGWINKVGGKPTGTVHRTQETASNAGRTIARQEQSEHSIHGRNGQVREKNRYGSDPNPPKDKR